MNIIGEKLNTIVEYLTKLNCPIVNLLQSPLENEEIDKLMVDIPISLPNDVISLFKWRNGVDANKDNYIGATKLFPRAAFYEFSHCINRYKEGAGREQYWDSSKFMIFESGAGEMYLIECNPDSQNFGTIYLYDLCAIEFDTLIPIYASVASLLDTVLECYSNGIYTCDPLTGVTTENYEMYLREFEILKKHNPRSSYWSLFSSPDM